MKELIEELESRWSKLRDVMMYYAKDRWISQGSEDKFIEKNIYCFDQNSCFLLGLSGPGASGKTSVANNLKKNLGFNQIINVTTRSPRKNEKNGIDYWFLDQREFLRQKNNGQFIIDVEKSGRGNYGIYKKDISNAFKGTNSRIVFIESPLAVSSCINKSSYFTDRTIHPMMIYLLPKQPIITNLINFLSMRQETNKKEEIVVNHGWRQIEEFASNLSLDFNKFNIYVLEGFSPELVVKLIEKVV